jgi:hypothetical protein
MTKLKNINQPTFYIGSCSTSYNVCNVCNVRNLRNVCKHKKKSEENSEDFYENGCGDIFD